MRTLRTLKNLNWWLAGFLGLAMFCTIAAFSFLMGWENGLGLFLLAILLAGVLCGRFINPRNHPPQQPPPLYTQAQILEIGEWLIQVGEYLNTSANWLEVSLKQQREDTVLLKKLAEIYDAAQIICAEMDSLLQQNQQVYKIRIDLYRNLLKAVEKIDVAETIRLHLVKQWR